jgi:pyrroline-5-carboxylate reductase
MKLGFIGTGKMARALARGLVLAGRVAGPRIVCTSRSRESATKFIDLFPARVGPRWLADAAQVVRESDLIVLACKPQQLGDVLPPLRELSAGKLFLSLAAGTPIATIATALSPEARIVRAMPNTLVQVAAGASAYVAGPNVTKEDLAQVEAILSAAGRAWRVEEGQMDAITALSGSGPAYVLHFLDAFIRAGTKLGLPPRLAHDLAEQTLLGTAQLAASSELTPLELAAQVKSPQGTTVAGCAVLEEKDALGDLMIRCLTAARARAEELGGGHA